LVIAVIGGVFALMGQRSQSRSTEKVAQLSADGTAGQLALSIATNTQARLEALETWEVEVEDWWNNEHVPWDEAVEKELEKASPGAIERLPEKTPLPNRRRRKRGAPKPYPGGD
jgi:hypothetical protein